MMAQRTILLILFCVLTYRSTAQSNTPSFEGQCVQVRLPYSDDVGDTLGQLCVIKVTERENRTIHGSLWLLKHQTGWNELIGISTINVSDSMGCVLAVYDIQISEDNAFLAVLSGGEGSVWLYILDLKTMLTERKCHVVYELSPHPGGISNLRWAKNQLILTSDADLTKLNKQGHLSAIDIKPKESTYSLDPVTGKIIKK